MNEALIFESMIDIPGGNSDFSGPEGIVSADDGSLYVSSGDGWIYQVINNQVRPFAQVGGRPLGIAFDLDKNLFVCEPESGSIIRISPKGEIEKVIDRIGSRKLQAPNYAVFDDSGWLFFSDSGSSTIEIPKSDGAIYIISPEGECSLFYDHLFLPNGLAIRQDEPALYLAQSTEDNILRIDINKNRTPGDVIVFAEGIEHIPDGMAFLKSGDLLVVAGGMDTIYQIKPNGKVKTLFTDPPPSIDYLYAAANLAFGGPYLNELYISNLGGFITKFAGSLIGQPLYHQSSKINDEV